MAVSSRKMRSIAGAALNYFVCSTKTIINEVSPINPNKRENQRKFSDRVFMGKEKVVNQKR